jgi:RHS repeat-associated protein
LGSVRNVVDGMGDVQQAVNYTPYGVPDSAMTGFAFTGEPRDSNGLQYHRARYYAPELGLWASLDPLETDNRYGYALNNPLNFIDPSGLQTPDDPRIGTCDIHSGVIRDMCISYTYTKMEFLAEVGVSGISPYAGVALQYYLKGASLNNIRRRPVYINPKLILADDVFLNSLENRLKVRWLGNSNVQSFLNNVCIDPSRYKGISNNINTGETWEERNIRVSGALGNALGGSGIRPYAENLAMFVEDVAADILQISITQKLEFFDFYDWCGVSKGCPPDEPDVGLIGRQSLIGSPDYQVDPTQRTGLGTTDHPFNLFVGEFTSLEKAGYAKPYDMYAAWLHTIKYSIKYSCGSPIDVNSATVIDRTQIGDPPLTYDNLFFSLPVLGDVSTPNYPVPFRPPTFMGDLEKNGYLPSPLYATERSSY